MVALEAAERSSHCGLGGQRHHRRRRHQNARRSHHCPLRKDGGKERTAALLTCRGRLESPAHPPPAFFTKCCTRRLPLRPKARGKAEPTVDDRLQKLSDLLGKNLISQAEFEAKRQQILSEI